MTAGLAHAPPDSHATSSASLHLSIPASLHLLALLPAVAVLLAGCGAARNTLELSVRNPPSLRPTLSWQSLAEISAGADFTGVTYELRIYRAADGEPVYARKGLLEPRHQVEQPLQPLTQYRWTVRASFDFKGRPRLGPWAHAFARQADARQNIVPLRIETLPSFETPEK